MNDALGVLLTIVLLAGNAFFVGAEFALISARRDRLEALADKGKKRARTVIRASEHLSLMLAGAQLGITVCSILLGRIGEPAIAHLIEKPLDAVNVPSAALHPIAFTLALFLVVVVHILFGEMVPKNIALAGPEESAMILVPPHLVLMRAAKPVIYFYNWCATVALRILRVEPKDELDTAVSPEELAAMIAQSRAEGLIDAEEHARLTRALTTSDRAVLEVAIPLERVFSVQTQSEPGTGRQGPTLGSIERAVAETGYSRYPVRGIDGTYTGYLHLKDVLDEIVDDDIGPDSIIGAERIHPLPVIGADASLDDATTSLRRASSHLGAVVDQNGRTIGIVTLEDLVEEVVGTVRDGMHRNR